jgi:hypothetical protein
MLSKYMCMIRVRVLGVQEAYYLYQQFIGDIICSPFLLAGKDNGKCTPSEAWTSP